MYYFSFICSSRMLTTFLSMSRKISMDTSSENGRAIAMETILRCRPCVKFTIGRLRCTSIVLVGYLLFSHSSLQFPKLYVCTSFGYIAMEITLCTVSPCFSRHESLVSRDISREETLVSRREFRLTRITEPTRLA